jgi:hypothetical protein
VGTGILQTHVSEARRGAPSVVVGQMWATRHRNPVVRGLVEKPEDWAWSSYRHYLTGEVGTVEIESHWTIDRRLRERTE